MLKPGLYEQIIKNVVANAPDTYNIPVIQLERKISEINDDIAFSVKVKLQNDFGVVVTGFDIGEIEIDKSSDGYAQLMTALRDNSSATKEA